MFEYRHACPQKYAGIREAPPVFLRQTRPVVFLLLYARLAALKPVPQERWGDKGSSYVSGLYMGCGNSNSGSCARISLLK